MMPPCHCPSGPGRVDLTVSEPQFLHFQEMATFVAFPGRVDAGPNELSLQGMVSYMVCGAQCK